MAIWRSIQVKTVEGSRRIGNLTLSKIVCRCWSGSRYQRNFSKQLHCQQCLFHSQVVQGLGHLSLMLLSSHSTTAYLGFVPWRVPFSDLGNSDETLVPFQEVGLPSEALVFFVSNHSERVRQRYRESKRESKKDVDSETLNQWKVNLTIRVASSIIVSAAAFYWADHGLNSEFNTNPLNQRSYLNCQENRVAPETRV